MQNCKLMIMNGQFTPKKKKNTSRCRVGLFPENPQIILQIRDEWMLSSSNVDKIP